MKKEKEIDLDIRTELKYISLIPVRGEDNLVSHPSQSKASKCFRGVQT